MAFPDTVVSRLTSIYEDMLWLANRSHVTPRQARAWYSQVLAAPMAPKVRRFSGMVSEKSLENVRGRLVLEHFNRLSHSLSLLLERHLQESINNPAEFIDLIHECEQVNITTDDENHRVQQANGSYAEASVRLVPWVEVDAKKQLVLWQTKLKGKVINANEFRPRA